MLQEVAYTNSFYNIEADLNTLTIWDPYKRWDPGTEDNPSRFTYWGEYIQVKLQSGTYKDMNEICSLLNRTLEQSRVAQLKGNRIFSYNPVTRRVHFYLGSIQVALYIRGPVLNLVGAEFKAAKSKEYLVLGIEKKGS